MQEYEAKKKQEETDEEKKARIQKGLEALNLAQKPTDTAAQQQEKRKNFYHDIRNAMRD